MDNKTYINIMGDDEEALVARLEAVFTAIGVECRRFNSADGVGYSLVVLNPDSTAFARLAILPA